MLAPMMHATPIVVVSEYRVKPENAVEFAPAINASARPGAGTAPAPVGQPGHRCSGLVN